MTQSKKPEWLLHSEQHYQKRLNDLHESLMSRHGYDSTNLQVQVEILEPSKQPGRQSAYKQRITISDNQADLLALDIEDLWEIEGAEDFINPLSMIGEACVPITLASKTNRIELSPHLKESEIAALTQVATNLLQFIAALILIEEAEMLRQPAILQEVWKHEYLMRPEKFIEYQGIRYWRCDDPISWHA